MKHFIHPRIANLRVWFVILLLVAFSSAADDDEYELDRCTRWHHASMLRGDSIFIDGGVQVNRNNATTWLGFSKYIFEIDMSESWDVNTNYTEKRISRFGDTLMGANPPNMVRGALFRGPGNDTRVFTFAGSTFIANTSDPDWAAPSSNQYSLWSFDTTLQVWAQYDISQAVPQRPNWGSVGEAIGTGVGFYLNGQVDKGSSNVLYSTVEYIGGSVSNATDTEITYLDGMIIIDMPTQTARNVSSDTIGAPRVAGGLVHAPNFGKTSSGTLVAFGGMRSGNSAKDNFTNGILVDFTTVSLCDSFNEDNVTWVNQSTTGDIPYPRMDFCTLPAPKSAKDNSSYNFYIYGGYDPIQSIMYDDMYVLSLPSFTWTRVYSGTKPRFGHTCHTAGNRQMLLVGGSLNSSMYAVETTGQLPDLTTLTCDTKQGVSLFDLTNLTWGSYFDMYSSEYQLPEKVVNVIGGSRDGGATMTQPAGGFHDAAVSTMFNPPPTTTATPKNHSDTGAIVGGVIGAVAGVALVAGLGFWMLRKRSARQLRKVSHQEPAQDSAPHELGQDPACHELPEKTLLAEVAGEAAAKELVGNFPEEKENNNLQEHIVKQSVFHELPADISALYKAEDQEEQAVGR